MKTHEITTLKLENLVPNEDNPNQMDEPTLLKLCESIQEIGFTEPIMVAPIEDQTGKYRIVSGHHRHKACKELGYLEAPCIILKDWDRAKQDIEMVRANIIRGKMNPEKFIKLYDTYADTYGEELLQQMMGFTDESALKEIKKQIKKGLPKNIQQQLQKAEEGKEIGSVEDLTKTVSDLMADYGESVPYNFIHFNHGGKKHIMQRCDEELWETIDKLYKGCEKQGMDSGKVIRILFRQWERVVFLEKLPDRLTEEAIDNIEEQEGGN